MRTRTTDAGGRGIVSDLSGYEVEFEVVEENDDEGEGVEEVGEHEHEDGGKEAVGEEEEEGEEEEAGGQQEEEGQSPPRPNRIPGSKLTRINAWVPSGIRSWLTE